MSKLVYHHWGCSSINRPLSYPFISLVVSIHTCIGKKWQVSSYWHMRNLLCLNFASIFQLHFNRRCLSTILKHGSSVSYNMLIISKVKKCVSE